MLGYLRLFHTLKYCQYLNSTYKPLGCAVPQLYIHTLLVLPENSVFKKMKWVQIILENLLWFIYALQYNQNRQNQ